MTTTTATDPIEDAQLQVDEWRQLTEKLTGQLAALAEPSTPAEVATAAQDRGRLTAELESALSGHRRAREALRAAKLAALAMERDELWREASERLSVLEDAKVRVKELEVLCGHTSNRINMIDHRILNLTQESYQ